MVVLEPWSLGGDEHWMSVDEVRKEETVVVATLMRLRHCMALRSGVDAKTLDVWKYFDDMDRIGVG